MYSKLPTEYFLASRPGSRHSIEYVCTLATTRERGHAVAVAVAAPNVSQAAKLLFGTGVGIVGALDNDPSDLVSAARLTVAAGATEVAVPKITLEEPSLVPRLKSFLGSSVPLTVDITSPDGAADLALAEHALVLGADYVSYAPTASTANPTNQTANLVALAGELHLGGVKVGAEDQHAEVLLANEWAMAPGNARQCVPVEAPQL